MGCRYWTVGRGAPMGHINCGTHERRCCWRCDRCPTCEPDTGRLLRGDYCWDCTAKFKAEGCVWSSYSRNWVKPEPKPEPAVDPNLNLF